MKWDYWLALYLETHCVARGLRPSTIHAYRAVLEQFRAYARFRLDDAEPDAIRPVDVLGYVEHLREARDNGPSAVSRQVVVLKNFYRAIVAMGHLEPRENPMAQFPKLKGPARKLPVVLDAKEIKRLLKAPEADTVLGLRDRALLHLLYGTGIRSSECAALRECDVDLRYQTITVTGKGGHERTVPLNDAVVASLRIYRAARGVAGRDAPFFVTRRRTGMSRATVYERVRTHAQRARIAKRVTPHVLRHTFATHLVRCGVGLVTIRDLLGHRLITSTQIYLHVTAHDLREAANRHPIARLTKTVEALLPGVRLPLQRPPTGFQARDG